MIWTILVFVAAIVLYFVSAKLKNKACTCMSEKTEKHGGCPCCKGMLPKIVKLLSIILLIIGVNMTGKGTNFYLTKRHPEILNSMVEGMKAKEADLQKSRLKKVLKDEKALLKNAPIAGNENASKTIYLFTDHSCPYCQRVHNELLKVLADNSDVRVVLKPLSIHGPLSNAPAKAIIAAKIQDNAKAVALHNALMAKSYIPANAKRDDPAKLDRDVTKSVLRVAQSVGLDIVKLEKDMNESSVVSDELSSVQVLARDLGVSGTPFLIVEGQSFPGAIPANRINEALNNK